MHFRKKNNALLLLNQQQVKEAEQVERKLQAHLDKQSAMLAEVATAISGTKQRWQHNEEGRLRYEQQRLACFDSFDDSSLQEQEEQAHFFKEQQALYESETILGRLANMGLACLEYVSQAQDDGDAYEYVRWRDRAAMVAATLNNPNDIIEGRGHLRQDVFEVLGSEHARDYVTCQGNYLL